MRRSPEIGLGDLVRALVSLEVRDVSTALAIARCLSMQEESAHCRLSSQTEAVSSDNDEVSGSVISDATSAPAESELELNDVAEADLDDPLGPDADAAIEPLEDEPVMAPEWLPDSVQMAPLDAQAVTKVPPGEPLLEPDWTRALLQNALATRAADGPIDVATIAARLARRMPLVRLPCRPRSTLRRGVQVLVDYGEGMVPFAQDQRMLLDRIRLLVGRERVQELRFAGCPGRGAGPGPRRTWRRYVAPLSGTPVLVLSDVGITRPPFSRDCATMDEWAVFARSVREAGCPIVALVPYPPARWPRMLVPLMTILTWDRTTTVAAVRQAVRKRWRHGYPTY